MSLSSQIKVPAQVKGAVGGGSGGGATSLDRLSDVVITSAASGDFLRNNGSNFVNTPLSAADIPGADTAVAHQVPTSDGAGGFTWEDQAGGTPTTDAGDLISGTLAAARLPGVLANVDTQAELLSAAGAQAAATGTPNGSKYLRDDNSWQAVSATDSTKLPLTGGTLTGALQATGTQSSPGSSITSLRRGSSGEWIVSCGSGGWLAVEYNGSQNHILGFTGIQITGGTTQPVSSTSSIWRDARDAIYLHSGSGCSLLSAKFVSRANSTAYGLCAAATGDVLRCLLQDSSSKRAFVLVDAAGTVTFESGSHADYVASSSPASGEVGVYVTAGVLTIKPGSAGTRSIAATASRAQA